jgi:energy-coupling factor transport system ATP-binding protein
MDPSVADRSAPLIDIAGLRFRYPGARDDALADFDLEIGEGEFLVVVGANGSGKSTLARLLGGLDKPTGARHALGCGHDLLTDQGRIDVRRDVGVLFQNPDNQLVAQCVEEDIAFGLENLGWSAVDMRRRVDEMLTRFQLEDLRHREPHLLSGGQKQRTALAGVLAVPRRVLVLDEPTTMLDAVGRDDVLAAVSELHAEGLAIVLITQEMDEVVGADRVVALEKGAAVFEGAAAALFADIDLVVRLRLGLPAPGALAVALGDRGRLLSRLPLTIDELLEEIASPS